MTEPLFTTHHLPIGGILRVALGPTRYWLKHLESEWRSAILRDSDPGTDVVNLTFDADPPPEEADVRRFGFTTTSDSVTLHPALADRPVVARPETPFVLPAGETVQIHMSSPLWVQVHLSGSTHPLEDFPTYRPPDTWFGPDTRTGELCYATRTSVRLSAADVTLHPLRATTLVTLHNAAASSLLLERIKLPILQLHLYRAPDGRHLTTSIRLVRESDHALALELLETPPEPDATTLRAPRRPERPRFTRALTALLG